MKHTLLIITALMLVVGCTESVTKDDLVDREGLLYKKFSESPFTGEVIYDENEKLIMGEVSNGKKNGKWKYWYSDGQKEKEGTYKGVDSYGDPINDGKWTEWYEAGQKRMEQNYKDDLRDGLHTYWFENGQKKYEGIFKDGEFDGKWTWWYMNGQKNLEGIFKEGKEYGLWAWWYDNGQKLSERTWKDGELIEWTQWDEDGNVTHHKKY